MSRTDKTDPYWVKVMRHHPRPEHDHTHGVCDLPELPLTTDYSSWSATRCHWTMNDRAECCTGCGCDMCSGYVTRRPERYAAKRQLHLVEDNARTLGGGLVEDLEVIQHRSRKDTRRWCKGKPGREHQPEVRQAQWANWRWQRDSSPCGMDVDYTSYRRRWRWRCFHEVACSICGKILIRFPTEKDCPIWQSQCDAVGEGSLMVAP